MPKTGIGVAAHQAHLVELTPADQDILSPEDRETHLAQLRWSWGSSPVHYAGVNVQFVVSSL